MNDKTLGALFLKELEAEAPATRKCLERMKPELFDWKPHEKSMAMMGLVTMAADMPMWITYIVEKGEVDFVTYPKFAPKSAEELVRHFDEAMEGARKALKEVSDEELQNSFVLRNGEIELMRTTKEESVGSTLNHWVHHRGQLTVYMRLNGIPVPSIYGPSADEQTF